MFSITFSSSNVDDADGKMMESPCIVQLKECTSSSEKIDLLTFWMTVYYTGISNNQ